MITWLLEKKRGPAVRGPRLCDTGALHPLWRSLVDAPGQSLLPTRTPLNLYHRQPARLNRVTDALTRAALATSLDEYAAVLREEPEVGAVVAREGWTKGETTRLNGFSARKSLFYLTLIRLRPNPTVMPHPGYLPRRHLCPIWPLPRPLVIHHPPPRRELCGRGVQQDGAGTGS